MSHRFPAGFIRPGYDPLKVPNAPTGVSASGGDASASVSFTPPTNVGGSAISAYYAVSNPGQITASAASSPVSVTGLTNGTAYTFTVWALNTYGPSPYSAASGSVTPVANPNRGLFAGGYGPDSGTYYNIIDYVTISTTGNATDFGDLTRAMQGTAAAGSSTRALFIAGYNGGFGGTQSRVDYVTIASTGNAASFGSILPSADLAWGGAASNSTRAMYCGGSPTTNVVQYFTIATTGNATDFGDLTIARYYAAACANSTRIVVGGGQTGAGSTARIDYVEIATTGNFTTFGSLLTGVDPREWPSGCSTSTNAFFIGGPGNGSSIAYVSFSSLGNSQSWSSLGYGVYSGGSTSSTTRGVVGGGNVYAGSNATNTITYFSVSSAGAAADFGDLTVGRSGGIASTSSTHGGLQ